MILILGAQYLNLNGFKCDYFTEHIELSSTVKFPLLTTPCYLTFTMITEAGSAHHTSLPNMHHDNRGRLSAHHTLLPNMYHDNRGRLSAYHILLPYMYHDNSGRLSAHHTLLLNMYHDNRGKHSAHQTFAT